MSITNENPRFIVIIPSRYGSSRFPGKPLAKIGGEPMIARVCRQVEKTGLPMAVATDDRRIADCVESLGYRAVMTSADHPNGTSRISEALARLRDMGIEADVAINVQGDEPFIDPTQIQALARTFVDEGDTMIATLCRRFDKANGFEALFDPNVVKLVFNLRMEAIYFSRSIIPYVRGVDWKQWLDTTDFFTHVGIYAYRTELLPRLVALPQTEHEKAESLEQLRWLDNGYTIKVRETDRPTVGIDTPEDLERAEKFLEKYLKNGL